VEFGPGSQRTCKIGLDVQASCAPSVYKGSPAVLYHNNRDGTFTNVTKAAKIFQPNGKNLSIAAADYDNDGWPDLFVANDGIDVYLYHNEHNGTFKEVALTTGIALTANGNPMAAMCMSLGDYDNDGFLDLYVSDFQGAGDHIWHNDREGFLEEISDRAGLTTATQGVLSFGGGFFDYDNDGQLDLFIANGQRISGSREDRPQHSLQADQFLISQRGWRAVCGCDDDVRHWVHNAVSGARRRVCGFR
jgi:enediyne biosynthesis protein E4